VDPGEVPELADGRVSKPVTADSLLGVLEQHRAAPIVQP
jgi:hypothetical protein